MKGGMGIFLFLPRPTWAAYVMQNVILLVGTNASLSGVHMSVYERGQGMVLFLIRSLYKTGRRAAA